MSGAGAERVVQPAEAAPEPIPSETTFPKLLNDLAERYGDERIALQEKRYGIWQPITWSAYRRRVRDFAHGLADLGVQPGEVVAVLGDNRPEWLIADFAITLLGGVMVGVNTWATARELQHILSHSDTRFLITVARFLRHDYAAILPELDLPKLERTICVGDGGRPEWLSYRELLTSSVPESTLDAEQREAGDEQPGDEEAREDVEDVQADEPAREPWQAGMGREHEGDGDAANALDVTPEAARGPRSGNWCVTRHPPEDARSAPSSM
jgi:long-subunit acyl-CoA synthetase (AMP-forming)